MEITSTSNVVTPSFQRQAAMPSSSSSVGNNQNATTSSSGVDNSSNKSSSEILKENEQKKEKQELDKVQEELNKELGSLNVEAKFGFDDESGSMYVSIYEKDSDKLLRKIPSDEVMRMMSKMKELMGSIIDKQA